MSNLDGRQLITQGRRTRLDGRPWAVRGDHWTPEQDDALRQMAGTVPREELQAAWLRRTGLERTQTALIVRCKRLGISARARGLSMTELERITGVDHRVINRAWLAPGLLQGRRWQGRGPHPGWWFELAAVERFIRAAPWLLQLPRMAPGHRLTQLVETLHRADPWRTRAELMAYLGIRSHVNLDRWVRRGLVPHQWRPKSGPGQGWMMIRGRDFPAIKAAIEAARAEGRARSRLRLSQRMRTAPRDAQGHVLAEAAA